MAVHLDGSNSFFVEHNGSQMNYSRMSLPGGCKQLMHQASCMLAPQTTGKPIGMRGHCFLHTFLQPHLKTRVATEAGSHSHLWLHGSSQHPPRDANNCDEQQTLMGGSSHMHWLTAPAKQSALGHQLKGAAVLQKWYKLRSDRLPDFSGILKRV